MKIKISLAQMDVKLGNPGANFGKTAEWVAQAASLGSDLILFPELWTTGYDLENWETHATSLGTGLFAKLSGLAAGCQIGIGGSLLEERQGRAYNTLVLYDSRGNLAAKYSKIHLFRLMDEDRWLAGGEHLTVLDTNWGRAGLGICYDLRFPEMWRDYTLAGATLILLVAEWPAVRVDHWRTLLRARAIENQTFVAAVNRVGVSKGETFGGYSALIDPWGKTVVEGNQSEALLAAEIDLGMVQKIRRRIPVLEDRRPEIYSSRENQLNQRM